MTYGVTIVDSHGESSDISKYWLPTIYLGSISIRTTRGWPYPSGTTKTFNVPYGAKLMAASIGNPLINGGGQGLNSQMYACKVHINQSRGSVTLKLDLCVVGLNARPGWVEGKKVTIGVFAYFENSSAGGGYGLELFSGRGLSSFLKSNYECYVCEKTISTNMNSNRSNTVGTGISTSAHPEAPLVFAHDSKHNGVYCQPYKSGGYWRIRVWRYREYRPRQGFRPVSSRVKLACFVKHSGAPSGHGLALYSSAGKCVYATPRMPLLARKFVNYGGRGRVGGRLSSEEMSNEPMYLTAGFGIHGSGHNKFPYGTRLKSNGDFTAEAFENWYYTGSKSGWWGGTVEGSPCPFIYASDYDI